MLDNRERGTVLAERGSLFVQISQRQPQVEARQGNLDMGAAEQLSLDFQRSSVFRLELLRAAGRCRLARSFFLAPRRHN